MSSPYRESKGSILKSLLIYIAMFLFLGVMTEVRQMRQHPLSAPVHPIR